MEAHPPACMLLFRDPAPENYAAMSHEQRAALLQRWNDWFDGLVADGKVQHGHPLEAKGRTISGLRGESVVDGPFAETKEAIGGYFYLTGVSLEEATAIAQGCPNLPYGMTIELRIVAEGCPLAHSLGRRTMKAVPA